MVAPVTICVPIYNVERYIERCARSLFEQTFPDIEYIFVDDCSPDNSIQILNEIIREYPQRMSHVNIIRNDVNRGLSAARNTAVDNCRTEFLIHVDSDDFLEKNAVELLIDKQKEGDYDIVTGNAKMLYADRTEVLRIGEPKEKKSLINVYLKQNANHALWGRLIRVSLYKNNGIKALEGFDIGEDRQTTPLLIYFAKSFSLIDECIYNYNRTNDYSLLRLSNSSPRNFSNMVVQLLKSYELLHSFFHDHNEEDYCRIVAFELANYVNMVSSLLVSQHQKETHNIAWSYYDNICSHYGVAIKGSFFKTYVKRSYYLSLLYLSVRRCVSGS